MTVAGGNTSGDNEEIDGVVESTHSGGGIRFDADGVLTLSSIAVVGNSTSGVQASGGGVFVGQGALVLLASSVSSNTTTGDSADGGGIFVRDGGVSVFDSTITTNSTAGDFAGGGGVSAENGMLSIQRSDITLNTTSGSNATGGGIESRGSQVTFDASTLSGNSTSSVNSDGGGLFFQDGNLSMTATIIQSNSTSGAASPGGGIAATNGVIEIVGTSLVENRTSGDMSDGAGIAVGGSMLSIVNATLSGNTASGLDAAGGAITSGQASEVSILQTTIANNSAAGTAGGIFVAAGANESLSIANSVVAGNADSGTAPDLTLPSVPGQLVLLSTLIADNTGTTLVEAQTIDASGNLIGSATGVGVIDPMLAPLANNGGTTPTHRPQSGSPVLDAGTDSLAVDSDLNPLVSDQRGTPFDRFFGTVDMGSVELQPPREPIIAWSNPENIFAGTALSDAQLNATTNTAGTFVYTPDIGSILNLGDAQTLMVQFTPMDLVNYASTSASVVVNVVEQSDLGDAPDTYATLRESNGPRHVVGSLKLGEAVDAEVNGQPSASADGDGGEDDGVTMISPFVSDALSTTIASVLVNVSARGKLDAWIDFDRNGVFDQVTEHIGGGTSIDLIGGKNIVPITVPAGAMPARPSRDFGSAAPADCYPPAKPRMERSRITRSRSSTAPHCRRSICSYREARSRCHAIWAISWSSDGRTCCFAHPRPRLDVTRSSGMYSATCSRSTTVTAMRFRPADLPTTAWTG